MRELHSLEIAIAVQAQQAVQRGGKADEIGNELATVSKSARTNGGVASAGASRCSARCKMHVNPDLFAVPVVGRSQGSGHLWIRITFFCRSEQENACACSDQSQRGLVSGQLLGVRSWNRVVPDPQGRR